MTELRVPYTSRDQDTLVRDAIDYIAAYLPSVGRVREGNPTFNFISMILGFIGSYNLSIDHHFLESILANTSLPKNAALIAESLLYEWKGPLPSRADLTFTPLNGQVPSGGISIPDKTPVARKSSPGFTFLVLGAHRLEEGQTELTVPSVEGVQILSENPLNLESINLREQGDIIWRVSLLNPSVWGESIEFRVAGEKWTRLGLWEKSPSENFAGYRVVVDPETLVTTIFGFTSGNLKTRRPPVSANLEVDYIFTNGEAGATEAGEITSILSGLSSQVNCTNNNDSSGGSNGDSTDDIRINAPRSYYTEQSLITVPDIKANIEKRSDVSLAQVGSITGSSMRIYVLPNQGLIASSSLLDEIRFDIQSRSIPGYLIQPSAVSEGFHEIELSVILFNRNFSKEDVIQRVRKAILDIADQQARVIGRGLAISDVDAAIENLDSGTLVDYVDISKMTRTPRIDKSNSSSPDMQNEVEVLEGARRATYVITSIDATRYVITRNGVQEAQQGVLNQEYTSDDGTVKWTLGNSVDTFSSPYGDTYTIYTSAFKGNVKLQEGEIPAFSAETDISVTVFYPGEYDD